MNRYNPNIHHRRSIRLKGYDYSQKGLYFVTICTQKRECLFGKIIDNVMILNIAGEMVNKIWLEIPQIFPKIKSHEYIIMPNHFHAIIEIVGADSISAQHADSISAQHADSISAQHANSISAQHADHMVSLPRIIQTFKRYTTVEYIKLVKQNLLPPFEKRIWQRNYYEHIIRDEKSFKIISEYIINNPLKWNKDKYYER